MLASLCVSFFSVPRRIFAVVVLWLISNLALAHPHNWIDLKTELLINSRYELVGIKMRWQFDPYYSMTVVSELQQSGQNMSQQLAGIGEEMVINLTKEAYYSQIEVGQKPLKLPVPREYSLLAEGASLVLSMDFALPKPVSLSHQKITLSTFDPTYYVAMNYRDSHDLILPATISANCQWQLIVPKPDEKTIEYASSLDREQKDTQGLGQLFAETMQLECLP